MPFAAGDRVEHRTMGPGTVQRREKGDVHVVYDRIQRNGEHAVGIYDTNWFNIYPGMLGKLPHTQEK